MHDRETPDCVLWGGYAGGNTGDELLLAAALRDAQARFGDSVAVLSRNPPCTSWLFPEVEVIPYPPRLPAPLPGIFGAAYTLGRRRGLLPDAYAWRYGRRARRGATLPPWARVVANARELYLVGGGYLTDHFAIDYFLLPLWVARAAQVPIATAPLGLGPFGAERAAARTADALRGAQLRVRDRESLDFCARHDLVAGLAADDGFRVRELVPESGVTRASAGRTIGVCIFPQHGADFAAARPWWVRLLTVLRDVEPSLRVEGFCFHTEPTRDFATLVTLFRAVGLDLRAVRAPDADFRDAVARIGGYDAVIASRFHAVVTAAALSVPAVAVAGGEYYRAKMVAAADAGGVRVVDPGRESPEEVARYAVNRVRTDAARAHPR